jgi:F-type H+-transporting ATPase subunit gamma
VDSDEKPVKNEFEFVPDVTTVLENVTKSYVSGFIYAALVDSFCSEQNARMTAMNSANQNAEEILGELKIQYNRVRQAAITQEITEVSAGAKAQKRKRKMKLEMQKQS